MDAILDGFEDKTSTVTPSCDKPIPDLPTGWGKRQNGSGTTYHYPCKSSPKSESSSSIELGKSSQRQF